ncbi:MAG TPA: hypothetical protein VHV30_12110 [Polyangiaceae bacterium]|nr:hypothetical protein [Polyangiaceae bacterium]
MKTPVDARLRDEAARFAFRFACDDCAHFDAGAARCSLQFPATLRRGALEEAPAIELCKAFELT